MKCDPAPLFRQMKQNFKILNFKYSFFIPGSKGIFASGGPSFPVFAAIFIRCRAQAAHKFILRIRFPATGGLPAAGFPACGFP